MASQVGNVSGPVIAVPRSSSRLSGKLLISAGLIAFWVIMAC